MPNGIDSRGNVPVSAKSIENIKFGLMDSKIDAIHLANNLDNLITDIESVSGNVAQLGITVDQLKHVYGKIVGRKGVLREEFPAAQMDTLGRIIEQAEAINAEKESESTGTETESAYSPETVAKSDQSKIDSAVDAYVAWRKFYTDSDLMNTGKIGISINKQITEHLNTLKALKGLESVQKGTLPDAAEDQMIATIDNAQQLKKWHDNIMTQGQTRAAA